MHLPHVIEPNTHIPDRSARRNLTADGHTSDAWHLATPEGRSIRGTAQPLRGLGWISTQLSARDVASDTLDHVLDSLDSRYPDIRWFIQTPTPAEPR